ncbi:MAG: hypothetical protein ABI700_02115 [Chloroflexota bacterium]
MSTVKPLQTSASGEVCIANISTEERSKRLKFGVMAFAVGLVLLALLIATGSNRLFRLPLMLVFWAAMTGYFQWHDKTCVGLAKINSRKFGETAEKIEDTAELAQIQRQARRVQLKAFAAAIPLTLIALALPVLV